jgi:hypothetical protein
MAFTASSWGQGQLLTGLSPGSSETGFEAVITKANLPTSALDAGSLTCLNGGGDWRFSTDINGATQLPVDIVTCVTNASAASTEFIAWVRFPTYASGTRSVYAFWNKAGESQPAASAAFGSEDVWQDNESVWHLDDLTDSAGNATSLTAVGSPTTVDGVVGDGKRFASDSDYLYTSTVGVVENDSFNISFWYKRQVGDALPDGAAIGIADNSDFFDNYGIIFDVGSGDNLIVKLFSRNTSTSPSEVFRIPNFLEGDSGFVSVNQSSSGSSASAIHQGTVYTGSASARLFGAIPDRLSFNRMMDSSPESGGLMVLDEIRLTSPGNTKSSDRIELEYDNQSNPSSFWTAGAVFVPGGSSISVTGATPDYNYSSILGAVDLTPQITIIAETANYSYLAIPAVVNLTPQIAITGVTPNYVYSAILGTVEFLGTVTVTGLTPNYTYSSIRATVQVGDRVYLNNFIGQEYEQDVFDGVVKNSRVNGITINTPTFIGIAK